ncbi:hypothetical protein ACFY1B_34945 [Streptomyces mirabilis]|uniref:hypothetical protein n=1 Tax=Streptomyces mirabilis TaxID=68239 RepID=UPI0036A1A738
MYGYGGLKLIRRSAFRQLGEAVDVLAALPGRTQFIKEIAGTTRISQSPCHAWKAGFRECAMLSHGSEYNMDDREAAERIAAWTGGGEGEFAQFAVSGAREGVAFAGEGPWPGAVRQDQRSGVAARTVHHQARRAGGRWVNRGLVLVEPGGHRAGGHRHGTLAAFAAAHGNTLVVAPHGVTAETAIALAKAGARVTGPVGRLPCMLAAGAVVAERLAGAGRRAFASRRWHAVVRRVLHQVTLLVCCLFEAACVRTAHRLAGGAAVVVLSASEWCAS